MNDSFTNARNGITHPLLRLHCLHIPRHERPLQSFSLVCIGWASIGCLIRDPSGELRLYVNSIPLAATGWPINWLLGPNRDPSIPDLESDLGLKFICMQHRHIPEADLSQLPKSDSGGLKRQHGHTPKPDLPWLLDPYFSNCRYSWGLLNVGVEVLLNQAWY